jgi:hypothetical protein
MRTPTTASPGGHRWSDQRDRRAGWHHRQAGATKNVAKQIGLSIRRAQQLNTGEAAGVPQWLAEHIDALITGDRTTPFPLITAALELVYERTATELDDEDVLARLLEVCRIETEQQGQLDPAQLDRRTTPDCRDALRRIRDTAPLQAIALLEMSALAGIQLRRLA